ncbi:DGQHR domain-containing protein DpdB [Candidatus Poriferisodalis sp.]|uniref:DGQHR domain-containing protein DpdB n=1 Tax=Candidatus Poriferisodalis sp. TaxID=3101277 RepID=UPI003B02C639
MTRTLRRRALCIEQARSGPLYLFTLRADEIRQVADVARVNRSQANELIGYQRREIRNHVNEILEYLNGDDVLFPNALILALTSDFAFKRSRGPDNEDGLAKAGVLEIPIPDDGFPRPAFIVDGQQRAKALAVAERHDFPVPISAFVAESVALQRDQFLRVNNAKPLPRGLVEELLPAALTPLPANLAPKRIPAELCELLDTEQDSPFHGLIKRPSKSRTRVAVVAAGSVIDMLHDSLNSPGGCLFPFRNLATGESDFDRIWMTLTTYWSGVRDTFPDAWGMPPSQSRLMHGAGIRAMGRLMDKVMVSVDLESDAATATVCVSLAHVAPFCRWTAGSWEELRLKWNEIENTPRHHKLLSNYLIRAYFNMRLGQ